MPGAPACGCQARFDRLAARPTATAAEQLSAALLEMVAIKRAVRCGCLATTAGPGPTAADIFGLCAAVARGDGCATARRAWVG